MSLRAAHLGTEDRSSDRIFSLQKVCEHRRQLWAWGVTPDRRAVGVRLTGFRPELLVLPSPEQWVQALPGPLKPGENPPPVVDSQVQEVFAEWLDPSGKSETRRWYVESAEAVYKTRVHGFWNDKRYFLVRLVFPDLWSYYGFLSDHRQHKLDAGLTVYHAEVSVELQWLVKHRFNYQQWLQLPRTGVPLRAGNRWTQCQLEYHVSWDSLCAVAQPETLPLVAPVLRLFLRAHAFSADAVKALTTGQSKGSYYAAHPQRPFDRVACISCLLCWGDDVAGYPFAECTFTLAGLPELRERFGDALRVCTSEESLLAAFDGWLVGWDPDQVFVYPDGDASLAYLMKRHRGADRPSQAPWSRFHKDPYLSLGFKDAKCEPLTSETKVEERWRVQFPGRSVVSQQTLLLKKSLNLPNYSLNRVVRYFKPHKAALEPQVLKVPVTSPLPPNNAVNFWCATGDWVSLVRHTQHEVQCMVMLEQCLNQGIEMARASAVNRYSLEGNALDGTQKSNFTCLLYEMCVSNRYNNKEVLTTKPLVVSLSEYPPTFVAPIEVPPNRAFRDLCLRRLEQQHKPFNRTAKFTGRQVSRFYRLSALGQGGESLAATHCSDSDSEEDEDSKLNQELDAYVQGLCEEKAVATPVRNSAMGSSSLNAAPASTVVGGSVLHPSPGNYLDQILAILDFASLYPSIMMAWKVGYGNVVFTMEELQEALRLGRRVNIIPVNAKLGLGAVLVEGPDMVADLEVRLVGERRAVKKLMNEESDAFRKSVLDQMQLALKLLCNAMYGFLGARASRGALMPQPLLMYIVTAIGRCCQTMCSALLALLYQFDASGRRVLTSLACVVLELLDEVVDLSGQKPRRLHQELGQLMNGFDQTQVAVKGSEAYQRLVRQPSYRDCAFVAEAWVPVSTVWESPTAAVTGCLVMCACCASS